MDNDFVIPPDIPPVKREAILTIKAAIERFIEKSNGKPHNWATIEAQEQMEKEIKNLIASYPPGMFGVPSGSGPRLTEKRVYNGFVIEVHAFPRENAQYSTLSGIRKLGDPATRHSPVHIDDETQPKSTFLQKKLRKRPMIQNVTSGTLDRTRYASKLSQAERSSV